MAAINVTTAPTLYAGATDATFFVASDIPGTASMVWTFGGAADQVIPVAGTVGSALLGRVLDNGVNFVTVNGVALNAAHAAVGNPFNHNYPLAAGRSPTGDDQSSGGWVAGVVTPPQTYSETGEVNSLFGAPASNDGTLAADQNSYAYNEPPAAAETYAYTEPPAAPVETYEYTPPTETYTPPVETYTPPAETYTPPADTYSPPASYSSVAVTEPDSTTDDEDDSA